MKSILIIICILLKITSVNSQKVIFKSNIKRSVLRTETFIGITLKGESYNYDQWKNICKGCQDSISNANIWIVDSIQTNYIILKQYYESDSSYIFDTINYSQTEKREKYYKEWFLVEYFNSPDGNYLKDKLVFKFPKHILRKKVEWEKIESINFSKRDNCGQMSAMIPLQATILTLGAPIIAFEEGKFHWDLFLIGELIGLSKVFTIHRYLDSLKVKRYQMNSWKMKIK